MDNHEEENLIGDLFDEMTADDRAAIMQNMDTPGIDDDMELGPNEQGCCISEVLKPDEMNDEDMMMFANINVLPLANPTSQVPNLSIDAEVKRRL